MSSAARSTASPLAVDIEPWLKENIPVMTRVRLYDVGPADTWKFEARISGPAEADLGTSPLSLVSPSSATKSGSKVRSARSHHCCTPGGDNYGRAIVGR